MRDRPSMKKKYYVSLKTQFENMGDLLINRELIKILSTHGNVYINCNSAPTDFVEKILPDIENNCTPLNTKFELIGFYLKALLNFFSKKDKYVFAQNPGGYGGEISERAMYRKRINTKIKAALAFFGIDFVAFGVSYDSIGPRHTATLKEQYKLYSKHYVRDEQSYNYCIDNSIKCDGILPDLAFNLEYRTQHTHSNCKIILSFRELGSESLDSLLIESIIRVVSDLSRRTDSTDISITYQVTFDKDFSEKIASALSAHMGLSIKTIDLTKSLSDNFNIYSKANYTLSNRLHVLLMAMSVGSQSYALTHPEKNAKLVNLLASEHLEDTMISITDNKTQLLNTNSIQDLGNTFKTNQKKLNTARV